MPRTRDRLEMVRLADTGWSIPRIAQHLQISEVGVRYWVKRFLEDGFDALPDAPHLGRRSRLTPGVLEALREEVRQENRSFTAAQLCAWLAAQHGVRLSPQHLASLLRRARLLYKRSYRSLKHKQDPEVVAVAREDLQTFAKGGK